jgi:aspartokinase-like uncharacterized kinase
MWVVKLGGSLGLDPQLPAWLSLLAQLGGGRVTVVCGGGSFADEVRRAQGHWRFDDLAAHRMAVLAMAQSAYMAQALQPALQLASHSADILQVLHGGHTALWLPLGDAVAPQGIGTPWDDGADSLALDLATALNAERLVVVKSCPIAPGLSVAQQAEAGVLDSGFASRAKRAAFPIDLLHKADLAAMRAMLIGDGRWAGAT